MLSLSSSSSAVLVSNSEQNSNSIALTGQILALDLHRSEIAQQRQRHQLGLKQLLCQLLYIGRRHCLNLFHDLVYAEESPEVHLLPGQVRHPAAGALEPNDHIALQLVFGPLQLDLADRLFLETPQFVEGKLQDLPGLIDRGSGVYTQRAGIAKRVHLREDRVSQPLILANGLEKPRTHPAAQHRIQ